VPAASAPSHEPSRHRVRPGETLSGIAHQLGVSLDALVGANGLDDADLIFSGTSLRIPGRSAGGGGGGGGGGAARRVHVVAAGDTLWGIARRYRVSTDALAFANGLADHHLIPIGKRLVVPGRGGGGGGGGSHSPANWPKRLRQSPDRQAYAPIFDLWATRYGVPADLLKAMTWLESGWQHGIVSSTGAIGIGQLMPDTVDFVSVLIGKKLNPWNVNDNIRMSARYLRALLDATGGDAAKAVGAYYQGLQALRTRGMYRETLVYVSGVLSLRPRF
jgi:LysM repeat protein